MVIFLNKVWSYFHTDEWHIIIHDAFGYLNITKMSPSFPFHRRFHSFAENPNKFMTQASNARILWLTEKKNKRRYRTEVICMVAGAKNANEYGTSIPIT